MTNYDKLWQIMSKKDPELGKKTTWKISGISNFAPIKGADWDKKWTWESGADLEGKRCKKGRDPKRRSRNIEIISMSLYVHDLRI